MSEPTTHRGGTETLPKARADLIFRQLGEDWVIFDPQVNRIHVLNLTAAMVWAHCDGAETREGIVRQVHESCADAPDVAAVQEDVDRALKRFLAEGLLE